MDTKINLIVLLFAFLLRNAESRKVQSLELEKNILNQIFKTYDNSVRPAGHNDTDGPVVVEVNTYVRNIKDMDDVKMTYDVQLTFRMSWTDGRLAYAETNGLRYLTLQQPEKIWLPDLFFSNELTGHFHYLLAPNTLVRIFPNGKILYSKRVSMKLSCPMNLKYYPMDKQMCSIVCASYAYTTEDIVFVWKKADPVQVTKTLHMAKFSMDSFTTDYCTSRTNTGEYSCIKVNMYFSRNIYYYLQQAYLPTSALVLLSWVVFWLNPKRANIRFGIWVGILISMIIVTTSIANDTPEVSYTKAIDVWMGTCVCFVFSVILELCIVSSLMPDDLQASEDEKNIIRKDEKRQFSAFPFKWLNRYETRAQRLDVACRFLFPLAFAVFNFIYWL